MLRSGDGRLSRRSGNYLANRSRDGSWGGLGCHCRSHVRADLRGDFPLELHRRSDCDPELRLQDHVRLDWLGDSARQLHIDSRDKSQADCDGDSQGDSQSGSQADSNGESDLGAAAQEKREQQHVATRDPARPSRSCRQLERSPDRGVIGARVAFRVVAMLPSLSFKQLTLDPGGNLTK